MCTGVEIAALVAAGAATAGSVYSGVEQSKAAKRSAGLQREAMQQAEAETMSQMEQSRQAQRKANRKRPNVAALLATAQEASTTGPASTMLTGPGGTSSAPSLGRTNLLGQ
jgi:hypothetical protein